MKFDSFLGKDWLFTESNNPTGRAYFIGVLLFVYYLNGLWLELPNYIDDDSTEA